MERREGEADGQNEEGSDTGLDEVEGGLGLLGVSETVHYMRGCINTSGSTKWRQVRASGLRQTMCEEETSRVSQSRRQWQPALKRLCRVSDHSIENLCSDRLWS